MFCEAFIVVKIANKRHMWDARVVKETVMRGSGARVIRDWLYLADNDSTNYAANISLSKPLHLPHNRENMERTLLILSVEHVQE